MDEMLELLKERFVANAQHYKNITWETIQNRLEENPKAVRVVQAMEKTGGEPNLLDFDEKKDVFLFCDFSKESPSGRRSLCYDRKALEARKKHKPANSAKDVAKEMGIALLTEDQYKKLQTFGEFDTKTSSWLETPKAIREKGGAIFGDRRYDHVFIYHNGADSYYAARGFRGLLEL